MFNTSRRQLIRYGGGFLGTGLAATVLGSQLSQTNAQTAVNSEPWLTAQNQGLNPDQALTMLMEGNQRFWERRKKSPNRDQARLTEVAESQAPFAAILGCADSRVPAEIVFDQGLGDLFVCRVAGNLATSEEIGSLEFGTLVLGAKVIVVLGHSRCGAVKATIEGGRFPGQIGRLIDGLQVGVDRAERQPGSNKLERAIKSNVIYQVEKLGKSPVMGDLVDKKQLKIVGAYYDLDTGKVSLI
ncbi:carbonic anhydrase [Microcystis aeruginosa]|uniref:carbonic anhydrase n=1 Tax=Microcystis aeruginosa (strain NIES-843 / IAM M-2473) TaxID=449447 RepID=B0JV01_MICAN|nr:carbonic anhydrase [Microcystis aeruginosa]BAG01335.1 periplasmic beta-type carbonic anhydrase [Microcystis aeruginosa NIES-843]